MNPTTETFLPDNLLGGSVEEITTEGVTLASGSVYKSGSVLGAVTRSVPTTGTAGTNTGNGTATGVQARRYTATGVYTIKCTTVAANGGVFAVYDPSNRLMGYATVGTRFEHDQISLLINDGSTDFALNDSFTVTVSVGTYRCSLVNSANSDGTQNPKFVLLQDVDATSADAKGTGATGGQFNERVLIFGGTDTIETHREALRSVGILTKRALPA